MPDNLRTDENVNAAQIKRRRGLTEGCWEQIELSTWVQLSRYRIRQSSKRFTLPCRQWMISTLQLLPNRCNVANFSLLDVYFLRKCSDELDSLVLPVKTFTDKTRHAIYKRPSLRKPLVRKKFYSHIVFFNPPTAPTLWNRPPSRSSH